MELREANRILQSVRTALAADGVKLPQAAETDGLVMLLGRLDCNKYLAPKIKHAKTVTQGAARARANAVILFFRALEAVTAETVDPVTYVSVMMLHKNVCGDTDGEAGKPRSAELLTNGSAHTDPKYITGSLKSIVAKMNEIEKSPVISKEDFAGYLAHYIRELVIMHPFATHSEFVVRLFMMRFCRLKGFSLCYNRYPAAAIREAEQTAFQTDDVTPLYKMIYSCLSYERTSIAPQQPPKPRTRREIDRPKRETVKKPEGEQSPTGIKLPEEFSKSEMNEVKLRKMIKLQQKISRLNDQLTELTSDTPKLKTDKDKKE